MNNCLLYGNQADLQGGGVYQGVLNHCTVTDNTALGGGGGVVLPALTNCIVYSNHAPTDPNHAGATFNYSCSLPLPAGPGNIGVAPEFADPAIHDFRLRTTSPCVDAGDNASALMATDLAGNRRVQNGRADLGALESNGGYAAWASAISNGLTDYNESAAGDGLPNLIKYATGGSATLAQQGTLLSLPGTGGTPSLQFTWSRNALDVTTQVEASDGLSGPSWEVIATCTLGVWSPANGITEDGAGSFVTVSVEDPGAGGPKRFYRLRVTAP